METILFYVLLIAAVYMLRKNFDHYRQNKRLKEYTESAGDIFARKADAKERIDRYVAGETNLQLQNKGRILALYEALSRQTDIEETLASLDLHPLFSTNQGVSTVVFDPKKTLENADSMIWSMLVLTKMKSEKREDLIPLFLAKFTHQEELRHYMEFQLLEAIAAYCTSSEKEMTVFKNISNSDYSDILYNKRLIGMYKRISSFFLKLENIAEEYVEEDVRYFAESSVGKLMMSDLGVYELYGRKEVLKQSGETPLPAKDSADGEVSE